MNPVGALKYVYSEFRENYDEPGWIRNRLTQRVIRPIHRFYNSEDAVTIMDEDWDTLVVMDACRADLFEQVADFDRFDDYCRRTSVGSMTREWTHHNFCDGLYGDTVYVSANPYTSAVAGGSFHEIREVWREGFDDDERTVLPESVAKVAKNTHEDHPDKRLIIHFMQPHYPFVGHPELRFRSWDPDEIVADVSTDERPHDPWEALSMGLVDRDKVWDAYAENLELVLDSVSELVDTLDGRTVLTSDHGNMLGERVWPFPMRLYGHPEGIRHPALVEVPWAIIEGTGRRTVVNDGTTQVDDAEKKLVEDRLRDLGYV